MRNGAPAYMTMTFSTLKPTPADQDPASIDLKVKDPTGTVVETAVYPAGGIVRDSLGHFHWTSAALTYLPGGVYTFLAKAPGYPEIRIELSVEPSAW